LIEIKQNNLKKRFIHFSNVVQSLNQKLKNIQDLVLKEFKAKEILVLDVKFLKSQLEGRKSEIRNLESTIRNSRLETNDSLNQDESKTQNNFNPETFEPPNKDNKKASLIENEKKDQLIENLKSTIKSLSKQLEKLNFDNPKKEKEHSDDSMFSKNNRMCQSYSVSHHLIKDQVPVSLDLSKEKTEFRNEYTEDDLFEGEFNDPDLKYQMIQSTEFKEESNPQNDKFCKDIISKLREIRQTVLINNDIHIFRATKENQTMIKLEVENLKDFFEKIFPQEACNQNVQTNDELIAIFENFKTKVRESQGTSINERITIDLLNKNNSNLAKNNILENLLNEIKDQILQKTKFSFKKNDNQFKETKNFVFLFKKIQISQKSDQELLQEQFKLRVHESYILKTITKVGLIKKKLEIFEKKITDQGETSNKKIASIVLILKNLKGSIDKKIADFQAIKSTIIKKELSADQQKVSESDQLKEEISSLKDYTIKLEDQIVILKGEKNRLEMEIEDCEKTWSFQINDLVKKVDKLSKENSILKTDFSKSENRNQVKDLMFATTQMEDEIKKLSDQLTNVKADLNTSKEGNKILNEQIGRLMGEKSKFEQETRRKTISVNEELVTLKEEHQVLKKLSSAVVKCVGMEINSSSIDKIIQLIERMFESEEFLNDLKVFFKNKLELSIERDFIKDKTKEICLEWYMWRTQKLMFESRKSLIY
jgi:hypothetical protein